MKIDHHKNLIDCNLNDNLSLLYLYYKMRRKRTTRGHVEVLDLGRLNMSMSHVSVGNNC